MSVIILIILTLSLFAQKKKKVSYVDGVAVLTTDTFYDFLKVHKYVMVKFYAPWCGHCKTMAPGYARLAKKLKQDPEDIVIAKLDATIEGEIAEDFEVTSFPVIKLFFHGEAIEYEGEREEKKMEEWIRLQISTVVPVLESLEEVKKLESGQTVVLMSCGKKELALIKKFRALAASNPKLKFYMTHLESIQEYLEMRGENNMIVFRNFDDGRKILSLESETKMQTLKDFLDAVKNPLVLDFEIAAPDIFAKSIPTIILFTDDQDNEFITAFNEVARIKRSDILFAKSRLADGTGQKVADHIGLTSKDNNSVRILKFSGQDVVKYRLDKVTTESLIKFIEDFKANLLKSYMKSQKVPQNDRAPVKTIVADNFEDVVLKSNKYVLLEIYAPWCTHCKELAPIYEKLARKLSKVSELILGKYDGSANENANIKATSYPIIMLYKLRQKKKPIEYQGARNFQSLLQFLEKELDRDLIFAEDMDDGL